MPPTRIKRSNTSAAVPTTLEDGEIAINQADGTLWYHTANGGVASIVSSSSAGISQAVADARYLNTAGGNISGVLTVGGSSVVTTTDPRLSDARTPVAHTHGNLTNSGAIGSASGLPIITTTSGVLTTGTFGTTVGSFCQGSDSRLSDARSPTSHSHGNLTNSGAIGSIASLPIVTTTAGVLTTGTFGTTAGSFCAGDDARLSDSRQPTSHTHGNVTNIGAIGTTSGLPIITSSNGILTTGSFGTTAGTFCAGDDSRLVFGSIPDGAVTTVKLASNAVTYAKIQNVSAADKLLGRSSAGAGVVEEITCTSYGRAVLASSDASSARTTLGLAGMATQSNASVSITGGSINGTPIGNSTTSTGAFTTIVSYGNVGIGTTTPASRLDVRSGTSYATFCGSGATASYGPIDGGNSSVLNYAWSNPSSGNYWYESYNAITYQLFYVQAYSAANRFTINYLGQVGVGTDSPQQKLDVRGIVSAASHPTAGVSTFCCDGSSSQGVGFPGGTTVSLNTNQTIRLYVTQTGDIGIGSTNPIAKLHVEGGVYASNGINFGGVVSGTRSTTSSTLNDYEEGTWSPVLYASGATITGLTSIGKYTKIGRLVAVSGTVANSSRSGTTTGILKITGLPFTVATSSAGSPASGVVSSTDGWVSASPTCLYASPGLSALVLLLNQGATTTSLLTAANLAAGGGSSMDFSIVYFTS